MAGGIRCLAVHQDGTLKAGEEEKVSFWLCDLGLAVDSQSWVGEAGGLLKALNGQESLWRTTDIGRKS